MADFDVTFNLDEQTPVNADFSLGEHQSIEANFSIDVKNGDHDLLFNRDLTDQHPIKAITGLEDSLTSLSNDISVEENRAKGVEQELSNSIDSNHQAISNHVSDKNNPHEVTKEQVGLGNVDNTSDLNKPISTATQTALNAKQDVITDLATIRSGAGLGATALQPNDNVSELVNDAGYITSASLPTVNNGTLDIQVNGTSIGTFTANQAGNTTANIVVPDSATWGNITGTLSNQTDLQDALDDKQDTLTAGSGISIDANNVISSTIQESSYRGRWATWAAVPITASAYPEDWKYNHTPTYNDYMVVEDASGYVPADLLTVELIVLDMTNSNCTYKIGAQTYYAQRQSGQNAPFGPNNEMSWNTKGMGAQGTQITFNDQVKYQDRVYNRGESITLPNENGSFRVADLPKSFFIKRNVDSFEGSWRFKYNGIWSTDGKLGWVDEYQIESTLPIADDQTLGIAKLYTTTGQNTDGSMTQKSITDALNNKVDKNADITGATHTKITYDSKGLVTDGADITLSDVTDITATAAEVNVLDGITATTTELNYVDGVTSSIQTQIDGKQAKSSSSYNMGNSTGGWTAMSTAQQNALNSGATTTNIGQIATNTTNIANEIIDRQNADNGLQSQIDAIVAKSDVVDIVGTYAELQAYDTSGLGNNDVVKVISDSTHNDAPSYYRWVITGGVGAWVYIGSESETYTKAETDALLDGKQDVLTAGSNITISGNTISATDTTYTGSDGIILTGTNFTNSGVRSVSTGSTNGTISVNTNGTSVDVSVYGLGSAAYTASTSYATSAQGSLADTAVQPVDLATVATTGDYDDLINKPTIPAAQIQSDWTQVDNTKLDYIKNKPTLAAVATSGDYDDLINKPTIPTDTSDLTNGAGFITGITSSDVTTALGYTPYNSTNPNGYITSSALSGYATETWVGNQGYITGITSGDVTTALGYTPYDSSNPNGYTSNVGTVISVNNTSPDGNGNVTLSIPAAQVNSDWNANSGVAEILNKPTLGTMAAESASDYTPTASLATVATTGLYSDLSGTPTIPTVNNATLTINQGGTTKGTFTANSSSDVTIDLDAGGGSSRNVGEIVASSIPLTDAGLHLLDGSLISSGGSYDDFVTYIAGLVSDYPDLFETEANWQTAVTTYGVCGKFVYDSINGTVRLPKITGMIEGTTDATALGDLVEAGLPNITGSSGQVDCSSYTYNPDTTGAFYSDNSSKQYFMGRSAASTNTNGIMNFDASRSSSIYGNSQTVQPQTIKVLYYIVIATSTKTSIEVDIDEIATDLNGKADVDLSNCTRPYIVETYSSGTSWYRIWSDGWCEQGGQSSLIADFGTDTITLLKPYANTNYTITKGTMMPSSGDDTSYNDATCIRYATRTNSSFQIYNRGGVDGGRYVAWVTFGYLS